MKKIKLNTEICPILSVNTYNSLLEIPTNHIENDIEQLKDAGVEIPPLIELDTIHNYEKYGNDLAQYALQQIVNHAEENKDKIPFKLKFYKEVCFYSPEEYNFRGDAFDFYIQVNNQWHKDFIRYIKRENLWEKFKEHCKRFDSCSGFISFYPIPALCDSPTAYFDRMTDINEDYYISLVISFLIGFDDSEQYCFEIDWGEYICDKHEDYCYNNTINELYDKHF